MVSNVLPAFVVFVGKGLSAVPRVDLNNGDPPVVDDQFTARVGNTEIDAALIEADRARVVVPEGFAPGTYDVSITTPSGTTSTLPSALTVTDQAIRGCIDTSDCIDPCHSTGECVDNVCQLDPPDDPRCSFGLPTVIAELSDPAADDRSPTVTADLLEIYFASNRDSGNDADIWFATRADPSDPWSDPTLVAELSTSNRDDDGPEITADGLTIYISSNRDQVTNQQIYMSTRAARNQAWSEPVLVDELNTGAREDHAAPDSSHLRMVLRRGDLSDGDLFATSRGSLSDAWADPTPIVELNTGGGESSGYLEGDGTIMVLSSERRDGAGNHDIWITSRDTSSGVFVLPELIAELSGPGQDLDPWVSSDGAYVVFSSDRDGTFDLFEVR